MSPNLALDFLNRLWLPGEVRELRIPRHNRFGHTASGYFDSPEKLAVASRKWDGKANIYVSLNPVEPSLIARASNRIVERAEHTTSDQHVLRRTWLFLDIDADRPSGISSTDAELAKARAVADAVAAYLNSQSWPDPIVAMSGNGYYVLYRIDLPNSDDSNSLVKSVLDALAALFNTSEAHIDVSVANASRLVGLIGSTKVKGDRTPDRPHRVSTLVNVPEVIEVVSRKQLQAIVPEADTPATANGYAEANARGSGISLAETLERHGIEFREQPPDANGFTWYHVCQCPFHDDGRPFECGVGQKLPDGPFAGHCFHPEGQGKFWHDWKSALNLSFGKPAGSASSNGHLPTIVVPGRHLRDIVRDCWSALTVGDRPPTLFNYGGTLAQIRRVDGAIKVEALSITALKGRLDRVANFMKWSKPDNSLSPVRPPNDVVEDMLALELPLPPLSGIAGAPVFDESWTLVDTPGYQPSTHLFFESNDCRIPPVPETPSDGDLRQARSLLLEEWLGDFPFVEESSRAHAITALLSHVLRNRIDGPVPLFAVDAPTAGSGKTLLVESIGIITTGAAPAAMSLPRKDDELRKQITSVLLNGSPLVLLDNITHQLESGVLAAALTSRNWSDRLLGKSETVSVPNSTASGSPPATTSSSAARSPDVRPGFASIPRWTAPGSAAASSTIRLARGLSRTAVGCSGRCSFWLDAGLLSAARFGRGVPSARSSPGTASSAASSTPPAFPASSRTAPNSTATSTRSRRSGAPSSKPGGPRTRTAPSRPPSWSPWSGTTTSSPACSPRPATHPTTAPCRFASARPCPTAATVATAISSSASRAPTPTRRPVSTRWRKPLPITSLRHLPRISRSKRRAITGSMRVVRVVRETFPRPAHKTQRKTHGDTHAQPFLPYLLLHLPHYPHFPTYRFGETIIPAGGLREMRETFPQPARERSWRAINPHHPWVVVTKSIRADPVRYSGAQPVRVSPTSPVRQGGPSQCK